MRVIQVIDTLEAGGAERMAINLANSLAGHVEVSYLCSTRREGILKKELKKEVKYLFLNKKSSIDFSAFRKFKNFVLENKIDIIHAHSTSYFLCSLIKWYLGNKVKLVWHDHYGNSEFLNSRPKISLTFFSKYFNGILSVNGKLANWAKENLHIKLIQVVRNFIENDSEIRSKTEKLKGNSGDFKLICVANLRPQKDHMNLLKAFEMLDEEHVSLHLIGKDFEDDHSAKIFNFIEHSEKKHNIFYYGAREYIINYLNQADAGIISSISEGLPLALLEYGLAGLPVICTEVGECPNVLGSYGTLVPPGNPVKLSEAIKNQIAKKDFIGPVRFQEKVKIEHTAKSVLPKVLDFYRSI